MKNAATFEIKDINIVIEGQPINIQGCTIHYENEASVQELATGGSFIKDMIHEIKDFVKEAQASAQQQYNNRIADTPTPTITSTSTPVSTVTTSKSDDTFCEIQKSKAAPKKVEHRLDIAAAYNCLEKVLSDHRGWKNDGYGNIRYEDTDTKGEISLMGKKIECNFTEISNDKNRNEERNTSHVNIYIHEKYVNIIGIAPQFAAKWFQESTIPGIQNLWTIIKDFVKEDV